MRLSLYLSLSEEARTALRFAVITLVATLGSALTGMMIRTRLPQAHLSKESQDVVRLGMGLVATMTALLRDS